MLDDYREAILSRDYDAMLSFWSDSEEFVFAGDGRILGGSDAWKAEMARHYESTSRWEQWDWQSVHIVPLSESAASVRLTRPRVLARSDSLGRDSDFYAVEAVCCERPGRTGMAWSRVLRALRMSCLRLDSRRSGVRPRAYGPNDDKFPRPDLVRDSFVGSCGRVGSSVQPSVYPLLSQDRPYHLTVR